MDSRPRNNNGQFAPDEMSGVDANTTSAAYNPQIIEARKATLAEKLRRAVGIRRGVEESVPRIDSNVVNERIRGAGGAVLFNHGGHGEHGGVREFSILNKISNLTGMAQIKAGRDSLGAAKYNRSLRDAYRESAIKEAKYPYHDADLRYRLESSARHAAIERGFYAKNDVRRARKLINEGVRRRNISIGVGAGVVGAGAGAGYLATREKDLSAKLRLRELALARDPQTGELKEEGSAMGTAAKVGLGVAGLGGAAVAGTRGYHAIKTVREVGKGSFREGVSRIQTAHDFVGDKAVSALNKKASASAKAGWMGKFGKAGDFMAGNIFTKSMFAAKLRLRELAQGFAIPPEIAAQRMARRQELMKNPDYANVQGYLVKKDNQHIMESVLKRGGKPNIRDGQVVSAYFPGKKSLSAKLRLRELAEYKPSEEALRLRDATLAYNKFIGGKEDWQAASNSERGLKLRGAHAAANNAVQQKGIHSQWHLPFGIGKKAKAWRQYNQDMDWVNNQLSAKLRLRELARQAAYDPYAEPGQTGRDFRNAALGIGALGAGGGVAYAGFRGAQAAKSAQVLTDDALKTSGEARKAARSARVAAARVSRAGKVIKTQLTTFPTFKKVASKIFEEDLQGLKELAAKSVELNS
jgi:hypothetical protein